MAAMTSPTCAHCGLSLNLLYDHDGVYLEGYCSKFCRSDHEKALEAMRPPIDTDALKNVWVTKDTKLRDEAGQPVWFPRDDRPYFDTALRQTFHSKREKVEYMKTHHLIMDGSTAPARWPQEAGDNRSRCHRRAMRLED